MKSSLCGIQVVQTLKAGRSTEFVPKGRRVGVEVLGFRVLGFRV